MQKTEAARVLEFTEEEFMKALDWQNEWSFWKLPIFISISIFLQKLEF